MVSRFLTSVFVGHVNLIQPLRLHAVQKQLVFAFHDFKAFLVCWASLTGRLSPLHSEKEEDRKTTEPWDTIESNLAITQAAAHTPEMRPSPRTPGVFWNSSPGPPQKQVATQGGSPPLPVAADLGPRWDSCSSDRLESLTKQRRYLQAHPPLLHRVPGLANSFITFP